jgi:hypothetical protein
LNIYIYIYNCRFQQRNRLARHTPPAVHITQSRVIGEDDLRSGLHTGETRKVRMEKKVQKEASPPQKMSQKKPKKNK